MEKQSFVKLALGIAALNEIGFEQASKTTLASKLKNMSPNGSTAMLDSIMAGVSMILRLGQLMNKIDLDKTWNLVHIVLTDGDDNASKFKIEEACAAMALVGATLPVSMIKTFLIGIDVHIELL